MKKLFFLFILNLFFCVNCVTAQCLSSEQEYKDYFDKNIQNLDPIEGIWSQNFVLTEYNRGEIVRKDNEQNKGTVYIIKINDAFVPCGIKKNPQDVSDHTIHITFRKTAIDGVYLYNKEYYDKAKYITAKESANAVLTGNILEYKYKYSYELKKIKDWDALVYTNTQTGVETPQSDKDKEESIQDEDYVISYSHLRLYPNENAKKSVVGSGTGFALTSNGIIITNYHVIDGAKSIKVKGIGGNFYKTYNAKVLISDRNNDISLIQIDDNNFRSCGNIPYMIKGTTARVGESVFALGYPLKQLMGTEIKLTNGIISSNSGYKGDISTYQISVPLQPGNSGGALFDDNGNVIGIVNAKLTSGENVSYAIKSTYLLNLIQSSDVKLNLPSQNQLKGKNLSGKVDAVKNYIYVIEIE